MCRKYGVFDYEIYNNRIGISGCDNSAEVVEIPAEIDGLTVKIIENSAFEDCEKLRSVSIPDSVIHIGESAFSGCESLTSIKIPDSVIYIGAFAFSGCMELKSVAIPDTDKIRYIRQGTFLNCENLKLIIIPDGVRVISQEAFRGCESLISVMLPSSIKSIGLCAFCFCENLKSMTIMNPSCDIYDNSDTITSDFSNKFDGTIYGYDNSTAQKYAEKYNRKFISLGKAPENK